MGAPKYKKGKKVTKTKKELTQRANELLLFTQLKQKPVFRPGINISYMILLAIF